MGYRDDFYQEQNIIGWTGNIHNRPSVYFRRRAANRGWEFGHITVAHDNPENVGREEVRIAADYRIFNGVVDGEMRGREFWDGSIKHYSRHKFHRITTAHPPHFHLLTGRMLVFNKLKEIDRKRLYPTQEEQAAANLAMLQNAADVDAILGA